MAGDEAGIHARLRVLRKDFIEPAIAARHGRIVKLLGAGALAEFAATSLSATEVDARTLYGKVYCARGEVQSRIKEQQLDLFADRTSAATMGATQLRLWFASFGDVLIGVLRRIGLRFT